MQLNMPAAAQPIKLDVDGIGSVTCGPSQDPADVVEEFTRQAMEAGVPMTGEAMQQMMEYFCARKKCKRMQVNMPQGGGAQGLGGGLPSGGGSYISINTMIICKILFTLTIQTVNDSHFISVFIPI